MNWNGEVLFNAARRARFGLLSSYKEWDAGASGTNPAFTIRRGFNRQQMIKHVR
jgi:hypothetical protein